MSISERVGRRARWGHPDSGLVFLLEKGRCSDAGCTTVSREDTFSEMSQAQEDTPCQIPLGVGGVSLEESDSETRGRRTGAGACGRGRGAVLQ